ncbi:hypothetical protein Clacol_007298 [Clathrus columnatus]|uniref:UBX domain-containing protein n=1 Tax=Clathrus columnatus TaxID=1419009 RepID=A0AAV5AEI3_9AGAM|nr:hypothetical protein Clacol_007298 [Clathrus columnatus]
MSSLDSLNLTNEQRLSFERLRAITGHPGEDQSDERIHHELAILKSVEWDVERAINAVFSGPEQKMVPMNVDDSAQNASPSIPRRPRSMPPAFPIRMFFSLLSVAAYPITLTFGIISHIFRFLRIPLPRVPLGFNLASFTLPRGVIPGLNTTSRTLRIPDNPTSAAERLIRDLEEETSAMTISRARAIQSESTPAAGPSHIQNTLFTESTRKLLPDFYVGSYDSALQLARRDARPLCAILLSEEHDDTPAFKRDVLSDPEFVRALYDGEFIVWIGDIRASDAYQASLKLSATTYPFVAFIALQPRLLSSRSQGTSPPAALTVLSRHPSTTIPPPLTTAALIEHITATIVPRVRPLRLQVLAREEERRLREEQDAAFRAAEQADGERIRQRRREEAEAKERARLEEEARQTADEEERHRERRYQLYRQWLSYNLALLKPEPERGKGIRIGVRFPDGRLSIRRFDETSDVEDLYIWTGSILCNIEPSTAIDRKELNDFTPEHSFCLAATFPRFQVPYAKNQRLTEIDALKGGANLIVEGFRNPERVDGESDDDDEEEDEED